MKLPRMITPSRSTTKRTASILTGLALLLPVAVVGHEETAFSAHDQATTTFTKHVQCPNDASLQGYVSIADLNADIMEEYERIKEGGATPPNPYMISLCPGETFDVGRDGPLTPILDRMFVQCGGGSTSTSTSSSTSSSVDITLNPCVLDGGVIQIDIQDSPLRAPLQLDFYGLTFQNFEVGAIQASATAPSMATFTNSIWTDFEGANFLIQISENESPMTVNVNAATIRSSSGELKKASSEQGFVNVGGAIVVEGLLVESVEIAQLFSTSSGGETFVSASTIRRSDLNSVASNESGSRASIVDVVVQDNVNLGTAFLAQLPGSEIMVLDSTIIGNTARNPWIGLSALEGGKVSLVNSSFRSNQNLVFAVAVGGEESVAIIDDANFLSNSASQSVGESALVFARNGVVEMRRVEVGQNQDFETTILAVGGGSVDFQQVCWNGGNSMDEIAIFRDGSSNSEFSASLNFVSPEEESVTCSTPGSRIFTAENGCVGGADGASECMANDMVTNSPTPAGSPAPTAEGETFKKRVPCPGKTSSNSSSTELLGYTSVEDLNADMETEFKRVTANGATNSKYSYVLSLCPGQVFDVNEAPIRPVLGDLTILCGDPNTDDPDQKPCLIDGGVTQIEIFDSTVEEYVVTNILFKGFTFQNFTGVSIAAKASPPTVVTFQNSTWLLHESNNEQRVVDISNIEEPDSVRMTVMLQSPTITGATAKVPFSVNVLSNSGGSLGVDHLVVQNIRAEALVFTSSGGETTIGASMVTRSSLGAVTQTLWGSTEVNDIHVTRMASLISAFVVETNAKSGLEPSDSRTIVRNATISNNPIKEAWTAFAVSWGGDLVVSGCVVENNENLQYGVLTKDEGSTSLIVDTKFVNNTANIVVAESALIRVLNGGTNMLRTELTRNAKFGAGLYASGDVRTKVSFRQTCWQDNANSFVVWIGPGPVEFSGNDNFVSQNEASLACAEDGQRILQEATMECLPGADDSDVCLVSELLPTPAPSTYDPTFTETFPPFDAGPPADVGSPSSSVPPNEQPSGPTSNSTSSDCDSYKSKKGKSSEGKGKHKDKSKGKGKKGKGKKSCKKGSKKVAFKKSKEFKKSKKGKKNKTAVVHGRVEKPNPNNDHKNHAYITQGRPVLSIEIEGDGSFAQPGPTENP